LRVPTMGKPAREGFVRTRLSTLGKFLGREPQGPLGAEPHAVRIALALLRAATSLRSVDERP
jgi:hypothetical protein